MATGVYHTYNVLKFKTLWAVFEAYPEVITAQEIVD
jgi:hypothetical protein